MKELKTTKQYDTLKNTYGETPFAFVQLDKNDIQLFWSTRRGTDGYSLLVRVYRDSDGTSWCEKMSGGGYNKTAAGYEAGCLKLGVKAEEDDLGARGPLMKYHVGGNFYNVPKTKLRKVT